ncbi:MAG: glycosyltransferase family 2 protein [Nitrospirota bacterium]
MSPIDISIVVPIYNEEENIYPLYNSITHVMKGLGKRYEIIFIDDGSSDNTFEKAREIFQKDSHLKVIRFRKNFGQTPAMQAGFDHARGNIIISMDGDLQNDPEDIPKFLEKIEEGYDIVCGWRKNRQDRLISRRIPSIIANGLISLITGIKIHDNGCSLKAYRSSIIKKTQLYSEMHRFIPAMASMTGARHTEIVVNHHPRRFGKSKYGISRVWKVLLDMLTIKMLIGFSTRPSILFLTLSLPFLISGIVFLSFSVKLYLDPVLFDSLPIILPLISCLFIFLFLHFFLLAMLSEMILKTGDFKQKDMIDMSLLKRL